MGKTNELDQSGAGMLRAVNGDGLDSMMAVGKSPWHYTFNKDMIKLLEKGTKITSKQVNKAAGLDWNVYQTPAYIYVGGDEPVLNEEGYVVKADNFAVGYKLVGTQREDGKVPVPDYYLNVRDDIHRVIGIVKKRYRIFQNVEAPIFLDNLVDSGDALYETAGSLHGGSQVWWLMKLPEGVIIEGSRGPGKPDLETYILLTNSHDGSTSIMVAIVTIRVVCQNTLSWALNGALRTMKIRHTESAKEQFMEARRTLELGFTYQAKLAELGDKMLHIPVNEEQFKKFLNDLVPTPDPILKDGRTTNQRGITMADNTKGTITQIYYHNDTQKEIEGTLWGVMQAVQYYSDHLSISRNTDDSSADENRFKRLTSGVNLGSDAYALASKKFAKVLA